MKKKKTNSFTYDISFINKEKGYHFSDKKLIRDIFNSVLSDSEIISNLKFSLDNVKKICVDFVFCSEDEIRKINKTYRNKDMPTDVISFALFSDADDSFSFDNSIHLGEIFISPSIAKKQAQKSFENEIVTLIIHGFLHLLGFDHLNNI